VTRSEVRLARRSYERGLLRATGRVAVRVSLGVSSSLLFSSCPLLNLTASDPPPRQTIPGPENDRLLDGVHGWALQCDGFAGIEAIALPTLARSPVKLTTRPFFMSAPDELGRFVYVGEGAGSDFFLANVDGRKDELLEKRAGSPLWNDTTEFIELSQRGGLVALGTRAYDESSPFEPKTEQHLEIWNLDDGSRADLGPVPAWSVAWFPDGRRLLVERRVPPVEIALHEPPPAAMRERNSAYRYPGCVTSLQIFDLATRTWSWVGWGSNPLLSPDGRGVLFYRGGGEHDSWCVTDLQGGSARTLELPGCIGFPLAWLADDIVLYPALATTGSDPGVCRTLQKRPRANWTIKAGRIGGPDFLMVIPSASRFTTVACSVRLGDQAHR
jgi:hypothetical protein